MQEATSSLQPFPLYSLQTEVIQERQMQSSESLTLFDLVWSGRGGEEMRVGLEVPLFAPNCIRWRLLTINSKAIHSK